VTIRRPNLPGSVLLSRKASCPCWVTPCRRLGFGVSAWRVKRLYRLYLVVVRMAADPLPGSHHAPFLLGKLVGTLSAARLGPMAMSIGSDGLKLTSTDRSQTQTSAS
jgi:hypothetical protein